MKHILKIVGGVITAVLVLDAFGFIAWVLSGQHPLDNFYIGTITAHVLRAIIY